MEDNFIKTAQRRIVHNKIQKGFPIGNFPYDLKKLKEELDELEKALLSGNIDEVSEECADLIILVLGIAEQFNEDIDMQFALFKKMLKNEKRKVIKLGPEQFDKVEGE